jgi:hypothetical protein
VMLTGYYYWGIFSATLRWFRSPCT